MTAVSSRWTGAASYKRSNPAAPWRHVDLFLLVSTVLVSVIGSVMVFSSTRGTDPDAFDTSVLERHLVFIAVGASAMVLVTMVDYRRLRDWALPGYVVVCLMLVFVVSPLGTEVRGTRAWFRIGTFQLQPSEFAKVALVAMLAALGAKFSGDIDTRRLVIMLSVAALPLGLILLQPDLGTALVFVAITMGVMLVAGVRPKQIAAMTLIGLSIVVGTLNSGVLEDYQTARLTVFLNPDAGLQAEAYNLNQSKIAIGSGGLVGKGIFEGTQTQLNVVPEQENDFIFTAIGEELGFVGASTVLALFAVICWRLWRIAQLARDSFGQLMCVGVLSMLVFQVFQNAGMTMGVMPITGIPLPLVSHGGSSTIAMFAALGMVQSVHMRRFT